MCVYVSEIEFRTLLPPSESRQGLRVGRGPSTHHQPLFVPAPQDIQAAVAGVWKEGWPGRGQEDASGHRNTGKARQDSTSTSAQLFSPPPPLSWAPTLNPGAFGRGLLPLSMGGVSPSLSPFLPVPPSLLKEGIKACQVWAPWRIRLPCVAQIREQGRHWVCPAGPGTGGTQKAARTRVPSKLS